MANCEQLKIEREETKNAILSGVKAELDKRLISSQSYFDKEETISWMLLLHNELLKNVDVCVCSSATALRNPPRDDDDCFDENFVNAEEEAAGKSLTIVPTNSDKKFHFFYSQVEVKRLLNDFVFPHMTLCTLVMNWFCGNPSIKTRPLKFLVPADFKNLGMKCEHQKMKVLMGAVIAGAKQVGLWDGRNGAWDIPRAIQLYESVRHLFEYPSQTMACWNDQISWRAVYN